MQHNLSQSLQVQKRDGAWQDLLIPAGHIAVLAGYTLERATCGKCPAVKYREVSMLSFCDTECITLPSNRLALQILSDANYFAPRNTLAYRLRAAEDAIIDMQSMIFRNCPDTVPSRYMHVYSPTALHSLYRQQLLCFCITAYNPALVFIKACELSRRLPV